MADNSSVHLVSRRSFLFSLAALTCLGIAPLEAKAASSFAPFSFGYVTDAHLVHGRPDSFLLLQESQLFLQDAIKQLNQEKLDFVIFGGDQVETPGKDDTNWQLFVDIAQVLTCPWSFVLGEKDVSGSPPVDKMRMYGPDWRNKGINTDNSYWSQTPLPGVHLIGLDTSRAESTAGDVSAEQIAWLKKDLAENKGKFTIVFSHHPILAPAPYDTGPPWDEYITARGDELREILGGCKDVHLAVSGHLHVNKVQQEQNVWYVSTASLDVYPCVYRIFRVTPESIQVETYQVSFPALVKKARQQIDGSTVAFKYNEHKPQAFADLAFGTKLDNFALLPMVAGQPARPLDEKKLKQMKEERQKQEPAPKNEKKPDNKKGDDEKPDKKKSDNKGDKTKVEDEKANKNKVDDAKTNKKKGKNAKKPELKDESRKNSNKGEEPSEMGSRSDETPSEPKPDETPSEPKSDETQSKPKLDETPSNPKPAAEKKSSREKKKSKLEKSKSKEEDLKSASPDQPSDRKSESPSDNTKEPALEDLKLDDLNRPGDGKDKTAPSGMTSE